MVVGPSTTLFRRTLLFPQLSVSFGGMSSGEYCIVGLSVTMGRGRISGGTFVVACQVKGVENTQPLTGVCRCRSGRWADFHQVEFLAKHLHKLEIRYNFGKSGPSEPGTPGPYRAGRRNGAASTNSMAVFGRIIFRVGADIRTCPRNDRMHLFCLLPNKTNATCATMLPGNTAAVVRRSGNDSAADGPPESLSRVANTGT